MVFQIQKVVFAKFLKTNNSYWMSFQTGSTTCWSRKGSPRGTMHFICWWKTTTDSWEEQRIQIWPCFSARRCTGKNRTNIYVWQWFYNCWSFLSSSNIQYLKFWFKNFKKWTKIPCLSGTNLVVTVYEKRPSFGIFTNKDHGWLIWIHWAKQRNADFIFI